MRLLRVTVDDKSDITAISAKLHLQLEGETFVMGNAALEKAREVRELVAALQRAAVKPTDIHVQGVKIASSTGLLIKNQKVQFNLLLATSPNQLPDVLGIISAQKNLKLQRLEWVFDEFEASIPLAARAMQKARRKADAIAVAAGHSITGVHNASDSWDMPVAHLNLLGAGGADFAMARARVDSTIDTGVEYSATQTLHIHMTVDFTLE